MKGKQAEIQVQSKGKEAGDGHGDVVAGPGDGSAARQGASSAGSADQRCRERAKFTF